MLDRRTGLDRRRCIRVELHTGYILLGYAIVGTVTFLWGIFAREIFQWLKSLMQ